MGLRNSNKGADNGAAKVAGQGEPAAASVGLAVARARRAAGLTQRDLADKLDVRLWMVDEWEAGAKPVAPDQLEKIAEAIGTTPDKLLGGDGAAASKPQPSAPAQPAAPASRSPQPPAPAPAQTQPPAPIRPQLNADQIRKAELPRGFRGFDEDATRKLLTEVAAAYERTTSERDEARRRAEQLEATLGTQQDYDSVVSERAALQQRVAELEAAASAAPEPVVDSEEVELLTMERDDLKGELDGLKVERDDLKKMVDDLNGRVAELTAAAAAPPPAPDEDLVAERDELQQRVEELEGKLASREESEQMLTRALLAAGRAGEELVKQAQAEAEAIVAGAQREAEEVEAEIEEKRRAIDKERDSVRRQLRREALASARSDLEALHREAEPVLEGLLALSDRLRALIWPDSVESVPDGELLEDLRPPKEAKEKAEPEPVAEDVDD